MIICHLMYSRCLLMYSKNTFDQHAGNWEKNQEQKRTWRSWEGRKKTGPLKKRLLCWSNLTPYWPESVNCSENLSLEIDKTSCFVSIDESAWCCLKLCTKQSFLHNVLNSRVGANAGLARKRIRHGQAGSCSRICLGQMDQGCQKKMLFCLDLCSRERLRILQQILTTQHWQHLMVGWRSSKIAMASGMVRRRSHICLQKKLPKEYFPHRREWKLILHPPQLHIWLENLKEAWVREIQRAPNCTRHLLPWRRKDAICDGQECFPQVFKGVASHPVHCCPNKTAWMSAMLFQEWLDDWNSELRGKNCPPPR